MHSLPKNFSQATIQDVIGHIAEEKFGRIFAQIVNDALSLAQFPFGFRECRFYPRVWDFRRQRFYFIEQFSRISRLLFLRPNPFERLADDFIYSFFHVTRLARRAVPRARCARACCTDKAPIGPAVPA
jgi:hypothetical protein